MRYELVFPSPESGTEKPSAFRFAVNRNRYVFSLNNDLQVAEQLGQKYGDYLERLMEAWIWLEREQFIGPKPGDNANWAFITRKGHRVVEAEDFSGYVQSSLFLAHIDPVLVRYVKPLFIRGDFDTAVFRAFKEVEVRVRQRAGLTHNDYGIDLMKEAFGPNGKLTNAAAPRAEQDRTRELLTGAIGVFKNPGSHREVQFNDAREVIDAICFANQLLRMVDRAAADATSS